MNRKCFSAFSLALTALAFTACTGPTKASHREPTSLTDSLHIEAALSEIVSAQKQPDEIEGLLTAIINIDLVSQDYLRAFDAKLEQGNTDMMSSPEYANLMTTRMLSESAAHRVVERYENLMANYWKAVDKKESLDEASAQLQKFRATLNQPQFLQVSARLALQNLAAELDLVPEQTYAEYYGEEKSVPKKVAAEKAFFDGFQFKSHAEYKKYMAGDDNTARMNDSIAKAVAQDRVVNRTVMLLSPMVQLELKANEASRQPQSIGPSTGENGNLNGGNFPARTWSLTFDDGPSKFTMPIINNLNAHTIKATFFWLARNVAAPSNKRAIAAAKAAYMDLQNHSYTHANLAKLGAEGLQREIVASSQLEAQYYGTKAQPSAPKFFRCPYGSGLKVPRVRQMIAQQGMVHVFWNVDSLDWRDHNVDSIIARTRNQMRQNGRGIILFHDIHARSITASNAIMADLKSYRARTIAQVVQEMNGGR